MWNKECVKTRLVFFGLSLVFFFTASCSYFLFAAEPADGANILPERERARVMDEWLQWRLEHLLPQLMRREGIDLWLVICTEPNPDPVYFSLLPAETLYVVRTAVLLFHDRGQELGVECLSAGSDVGGLYKTTWQDKKNKRQFASLAETIRQLNPKKIGINSSPLWGYGDGLSAGLKEKLVAALGPEYSRRLVSAERLCVGWLETRCPQELSVYRHVAAISHELIREFFSNRVIVPGITTRRDVEWWIRQRIRDSGLDPWFHPDISIQRRKKQQQPGLDAEVIRRGDLLHCDIGIKYLGLHSDMQWSAYVLNGNETDAPQGLKNALEKAKQLAAILMGEFAAGRTGNEIVAAAMNKGIAQGLRPLIYSHPIGLHGHAAGPPMDARPLEHAPEDIRSRGLYPLYFNTAYAIEFGVWTTVPEWDNQDVYIGFEENAVFTEQGCRFIDGQQMGLLLIK